MPLFNVAAKGSGIITPMMPNLRLSFSVDGLGLVWRDDPKGWLCVWNADIEDRAIEYAPGLFTPILTNHSGMIVSAGSTDVPQFKSYPGGLLYDIERRWHPSPDLVKLNPDYRTRHDRDEDMKTETSGGGRRAIRWAPLRPFMFPGHPKVTQSMKDNAWSAIRSYNRNQLCRPLAHVNAPFVPMTVAERDSGATVNPEKAERAWRKKQDRPCLDEFGRNGPWNALDEQHLQSQFALASAMGDDPMGVMNLCMLYMWVVQSWPPNKIGFNSNYSSEYTAERGPALFARLYTSCILAGIEWADPDWIKLWCGGFHGKNSGNGYRPREALQAIVDTMCGPDYGGRTSAKPRRIHEGRADGIANRTDPDIHHQPMFADSGQDFVDAHGNHYGPVNCAEKSFHRGMWIWFLNDVIECDEYVREFAADDFLIQPARLSEVKRYATDMANYFVDVNFLDDTHPSHVFGAHRRRFQEFTVEGPNGQLGFVDRQAIDDAIAAAIADDPGGDPNEGLPWQYDPTEATTNYTKTNHVWVRQFRRSAPYLGLWHIMGSRRYDHARGDTPDSESFEVCVPAYARHFGYDGNLQASIDYYAGTGTEINVKDDAVSGYNPNHWNTIWWAVERATNKISNLGSSSLVCATLGTMASNSGGGNSQLDPSTLWAATTATFGSNNQDTTAQLDSSTLLCFSASTQARNDGGVQEPQLDASSMVCFSRSTFATNNGQNNSQLDDSSMVCATLSTTAELGAGGAGAESDLLPSSMVCRTRTTYGSNNLDASSQLDSSEMVCATLPVSATNGLGDSAPLTFGAGVAELLIDIPEDGSGIDLVIENGDLVFSRALTSIVLTSILTDRRVDQEEDPRGYWADEEGDRWGSELWVLAREKATTQTAERVRDTVERSLEWAKQDGIFSSIEVVAEVTQIGQIGCSIALTEGSRRFWSSLWSPGADVIASRGNIGFRILAR